MPGTRWFAGTLVFAATALAGCGSTGGPPERAAAPPMRPAAVKAPPAAFVANAGQTDRRVRYLAQGSGFAFYFTDRGVTFSLAESRRRGVALQLRFRHANRHARPVASAPGAGTVSYLGAGRGADERGLTGYRELTYKQLWPGIDMRFRSEAGRLKYEFHVAPGADPNAIRLEYRGAKRLAVTPAGALAVHTGRGTLRDERPVSAQGSKDVPTRYALHGSGYGFALPQGHDRSKPLVIDPGIEFSGFLGGDGASYGSDVVVDASGDAYITGQTESPDFPTTLGAYRRTPKGAFDAYVTKVAGDGSSLLYSTYLGGSADDNASGIAVDAAGNAYVTGWTSSTDFPTTQGAYSRALASTSSYDGFVVKLAPDGSAPRYATYVGGSNEDAAHAVALDTQGNAYITGVTGSTDYPVTTGAAYAGGYDAFVTKLDAAGAGLVYSTLLGGAGLDHGRDVTVRAQGAYVTGLTATASPAFPTTAGAYDRTPNGGRDMFVIRLDGTGAPVLSTFLGGSEDDLASGIVVGGPGDIFVAGTSGSADFPSTPGAYDVSHNGGDDAVAVRLTPGGDNLEYATYLGGADNDGASHLRIAGPGGVYLTGRTMSRDFPTAPGAYDETYDGGFDAFATELDPFGTHLVASTFLGGTRDDTGSAIALDADGAVLVAGSTTSRTYPVTLQGWGSQFAGASNAFLTKLAAPAPPPAAPGGLRQLPGTDGCQSSNPATAAICTPAQGLDAATDVIVSPDGRNVYVAGLDALTSYARDTGAGALLQIGCLWRFTPNAGCTRDLPATSGPAGLAITPNGRAVYLADFAGSAVFAFARDPQSGVLTPLTGTDHCIRAASVQSTCGTLAPAATAMVQPRALAVSPDGRHLYVTGAGDGSVTALNINKAGGLTQVTSAGGRFGCIVDNPATNPACGDGRALMGADSIAIDPLGVAVFAGTGRTAGASSISGLQRERATGRLRALTGVGGCVAATARDGCEVDARLGHVTDLAVAEGAPNTLHATVDGTRVLTFDRFATAVRPRPGVDGCTSSTPVVGCSTGRGHAVGNALDVSPDGRDVYGVGAAVVELDRAPNGALKENPSKDACWKRPNSSPDCELLNGPVAMHGVAASPDGRNVYATSRAGEIAILARDVTPPECGDATITVQSDSVTPLTLPCSDPDGEAVTITVVDQPTLGSLGAVSGGTVDYTAPANQAGTTTFTFQATTADGATSTVGTYTVIVLTSGEAGGDVPQRLSLSLGAFAGFGPFTPGVTREYVASQPASVTSTAGDALLSIADPSPTATGRLVNGSFALTQALQVAADGGTFADVGGTATPTALRNYNGPVSNDAFGVAFRQRIGAAEALRTGTYAKTLVFTLSTTAP